jgi:uncharacterized radical SAM protein YgiQ
MTPAEVAARGWDTVDVVFVTGDAYVDHPSFAMALLGRVLEAEGFRVAILSQPDWRSCKPWKTFGRPRLCFAVSAGNMDSMLNHYTAGRKVRNDDAYSPGGRIGLRPDRATLAYCQRAREAFSGVPIIAGGVEASLRRLAHYDFWSDTVRRSILLDAKADLLVYGMGERPLVEIVQGLADGQTVEQFRNLRGVAYRLGAVEAASCRFPGSETGDSEREESRESRVEGRNEKPTLDSRLSTLPVLPSSFILHPSSLLLPSYEQVSTDKSAFAEMTRMIFEQTDPESARALVQFHGREAVVVNPPAWPLAEAEIDRIYGLPFTRRPHPSYGRQKIPAYETVKTSIQIHRGCFGGCTFCSIAAHEGRIIQSRSEGSILEEIRRLAGQPDFTGTLSDLGGPTANMYGMNCGKPEARKKCRRQSCLHPAICPNLAADHDRLLHLMESVRNQPGVKKALVASGIRMDLALQCPEYIRRIARHHTGGRLKVAPEHTDPEVLRLMKKPPIGVFEQFSAAFHKASQASGNEQYLVPYFIAGHPGCDLSVTIDLAIYLKRHNLRPDKVQDFIPGPMDIATCMYHTGIDPFSGKPVYVAKGGRERRLQRALLQYYKPENYRDVRAALIEAGREDLIGPGPECLIPEKQPRITNKPMKRESSKQKTTPGYRPHRKSAKRRPSH